MHDEYHLPPSREVIPNVLEALHCCLRRILWRQAIEHRTIAYGMGIGDQFKYAIWIFAKRIAHRV